MRIQYISFFIQISWNILQESTWRTFLDDDLALLLPFKWY